jgi:transglutaminase-like putative cysteine protease
MRIADLTKPNGDPLTALKTLQRGIYDSFEYQSGVTEVNSPIEVALEQRRGVCQDFAHIMTAIARTWGIPCRYVSGYLYHKGSRDRSAADATHAWVEAYLPSLGWIGFDPTNNIMAGERHIRAAVGRDYADVPPTRGTYKGGADSELSIAVSLEPAQAPVRHEDFLKVARPMSSPTPTASMPERLYHQQQQQQQQE